MHTVAEKGYGNATGSDICRPAGVTRPAFYATIYRYVAAGRVDQLPALLPMLAYYTLVPFVGREEAASELATEKAEPLKG